MSKKKFVTCDGNYAASHIAYMFSEVAAIYPITPSSNMAENVDEWSANGRKNIFGEEVKVVEMQSEGGASGAVHGSLQAGALTSTYTASQGLLLMIPNMYKIAGELLPAVFHVSARSLAAQALSIFGDHSDVMSARQTGFAMLATGSVQQIMDIAAVAHLAAIKSRVPFMHFFDGFRTSHEIQKVEVPEEEVLAKLLDRNALQRFRDNALNPEHPVTRGTAQNPDIYFQSREAANKYYDAIPDMVEEYMQEMSKISGREYHPFTYYGAPDAENIIIAMGSVTETIKETIDHLKAKGQKIGLISVHLYRPFSEKYFLKVLPKSVKRICVLDRTKEPGANGEPLYLDVKDIFYNKPNAPIIVGGRYGLSSKDTTPSMIISVYDNLKMNEPKNRFTLGIVDDVTFLSLPILPEICISCQDTYEAKFYGLGSDGTVGANKNSIKIIGEATDKYCQAYFAYDSKKSGGITVSHLRFGDNPIRSTYLVNTPDFVACHVPAYLEKYDMLKGLKKHGTFLFNSIWDVEETKEKLPNHMKKYLADNEISFYIINATKIAEEIGLGNRTNTIMQAAFFKVANVIPYEKAVDQMKYAIKKSYGNKGEDVVTMNNKAIDLGGEVTKINVPTEWKSLNVTKKVDNSLRPDFIKNVMDPINAQKGDDLPVSAFLNREDGTFPAGTTQYEKRGIAVNVPEWIADNCIQCNQCSYVCPHACIRPFILNEEEVKNAPAGTKTVKGIGGIKEYQFKIQLSPYDCTGCGNCADVCPSKQKALVMKPLETQIAEHERYMYMHEKVGYKDTILGKDKSVKNSQFAQPLFEFSGACAGCGETPYIKTITQLFGERMMVANATGCSSIYGGSAPATPYCANKQGHGPAWANSLFEDNAEYGLGISIGASQLRNRLALRMKAAIDTNISAELKTAFTEWLAGMDDVEKSKTTSASVIALLEKEKSPLAKEILDLKQYLVKKSIWIFGGDGWAYDIGYGGLDHVLASGDNVNVLVMDTEVYSNTGGQSSKATPVGAVAKFAASGKRIRKKDLGMMAMSYGYVYVAQVAMGASQSQYFKAVKEAESYPGPSLIIAYAPCINHGLRAGMGKTQEEEKLAVEAGYWSTYRYDPRLENEGKNPFQLDSNEPDWSKFQNFLMGEVRYSSLKKTFPEAAKELFVAAEENAKWRFNSYKRLASMDFSK
ncbi:MAG TPA: pyruvate:ferredoxin (flavodoxin) oxidoreductase [Bacteroidales bacterium]|nr:MAG: pyruvate:ferredoxin (flavodoxin) oxidoreductase [Bacteroidetes bacterium GWF2_33_38]HBF89092.1 pyruvate:ferredoxin (flavodoxin) oxidoreductase [Bacteroidales bacterium]